jgi:hypothetical protein
VTQINEGGSCEWCGRSFTQTSGRGRPRLYCRSSCRQRAYELRRREKEGALRPGEVPISRAAFRELQDKLYALTAALEDVDMDLSGSPKTGEYKAAFQHLYRVADQLRGLELDPSR